MLAASQQEQWVQQAGQPCHGNVALHMLADTAGRPADAGLGSSQVLTLRLGWEIVELTRQLYTNLRTFCPA